MRARLRVRQEEGDVFDVEIGNTATIGRSNENTVAFPKSQHVSRQHAILRCHNSWQYQIMDLGSRNGTFVNGRRVITPTVLDHGAVIRITGHELTFEQLEEPAGEGAFEATLAAGTDSVSQEAATVSLMVCDIRGFSSMSERLPEETLAKQLGEWFREAGNKVQASGGTVDKFIGDAILAYWHVEVEGREAAASALKTGRELLKLAAGRAWPGDQAPFKIAVALHFGPVTCGNIGLVAQRDATIIGDSVNTVFRIESRMKELGERLVASGEFQSALTAAENWRDLGEHRLRGKNQPVRLFAVD